MSGQKPNGKGTSAIQRFYRGTLYQAIILGLVSFTQPGIWDALNSLGAGGLATPAIVNAANVITYVIMIATCPLFAIAGNRWDLKWVLAAGTIGFTPYFAALYYNSLQDMHWLLIVGAVTCGVSAAALWVSEGAIAVGYPEPERRGAFIAIWMGLNKIGSLAGNSIQLATNMDDDGRRQGSINPKTYLILIAFSCAGLPLSLTLSKSKDLIRDNTKTDDDDDGLVERLLDHTNDPNPNTSQFSVRDAIKDLWNTMKARHILTLLPIYITIRWSTTYQGMYLTEYFTVRGRVLAGFISTVLGIIATILWGILLDAEGKGRIRLPLSRISRRWLVCNIGWWSILAVYTVQWVLNFIMQLKLQKSASTEKVILDISDPGYAKAIAAYCLFGFGSNASVVWLYWILGTFNHQVNKLAYSTATLRSAESLGFAIAYGIGSTTKISLMTNLIVSFVVFWISVPFPTYAAWNLKDTTAVESIQHMNDSDEEPLI